MDSQAGQGSVVSIESEEGPVLLVENIQHQQAAVLSGGEDDGGSGRAPGGRSQPDLTRPDPEEGADCEVLGPDLDATVSGRQEGLGEDCVALDCPH